VHPDELVRLSGELWQIAGRLREAGARLGGAVSQLSWQVGHRLDLEAQAAGARRLAEALADEAEDMARFLDHRAELFRTADGQGVGDLGRTLEAYSARGRFLQSKLAQVEGLDRWSGWAVGGSVAAGTIAAVEAGARGRHLEVFGGPSARVHPELGDNFKVAGPSSDRLPTAAETRIIQRILGVDEVGYGPKTKAAVVAFQQKHGIPVDDQVIIGPRTWAALMKEETAGPAAPTVPSHVGPASSAAELAERLRTNYPQYPLMEQWAGPIWKACQEVGLEPEIMAAQILAESNGNPGADAGRWAGKGLTQIEFGAHYKDIPGETREEKLAWIQDPENNLKFGAQILKDHVDKWVGKYGKEEGLKRAFQYWNYGSGAAEWVEAHTQSPDDWEFWVKKYHDTHLYIEAEDKWIEVAEKGNYGTENHWVKVTEFYQNLTSLPADTEVCTNVDVSEQTPTGSEREIPVPLEVTNENVAAPVLAPITSEPGERSPQSYDQVIDQFHVDDNHRYRQRDFNGDGTTDTFCNIYVSDVTRAMGAEVPHWVLADGSPTQGYPGDELTANATAQWLEEHGPTYGWREVSPEEAQDLANGGRPVVAAYDAKGATGHVAMVRPGKYDNATGPAISQAGAENLQRTTARDGFGANRLSSIRYYAHD